MLAACKPLITAAVARDGWTRRLPRKLVIDSALIIIT